MVKSLRRIQRRRRYMTLPGGADGGGGTVERCEDDELRQGLPVDDGDGDGDGDGGAASTWKLLGDGVGRALEVSLPPDSQASFESGAMIYMDGGIRLVTDFSMKKTYRRLLSGENMFHVKAKTGADQSGTVGIAPGLESDVTVFRLTDAVDDAGLCIRSGHYVASSANVDIQLASLKPSGMGIFKRFISGMGLFFMVAKGTGVAALNANGSLIAMPVEPGSSLVVDNDNLVAWSCGLEINPEWAIQPKRAKTSLLDRMSRAMKSSLTGEGIVMRLTPTSDVPGVVYIQTRAKGSIYQDRRISAIESRLTVRNIAIDAASAASAAGSAMDQGGGGRPAQTTKTPTRRCGRQSIRSCGA